MLPPPFDALDVNSLSRLRCAQGDHVFRQGDPTMGIFFVKSGNVCLTRVTESGNAVTIHNARAGDLFAEASIYSDHYHCDAVCSEGITKRLAIQIQDYRQLLTLHAIKSANERVLLAVALGKLNGSVTQFASQIGLTKEACYRALKDLSDQGLLVKTGRGSYAPTPQREDRHS
jgi:CRP-like cAMP-binding protein